MQISKIKFNEFNPNEMDKEELDSLKADVLARQKEGKPLFVDRIVVNEIQKGKLYELEDGEHRFLVAKELGWTEIPDEYIEIKRGRTEEEKLEDLFSHNLKGSINPIKQARLFKRMMEVKRLNQAQFSRKYNISKAQMSKIMKRLKEPEDIQEIVSKSKLSTSLVDELFTLPEDQTRLILQNLELDNMKVEDVRRFKIEMTMIRNTLEHIAGTPDLEKLRTVDWNKLDPKILEVHKKWFIEDSEKEGIKGFDEARWRFSLLLSSSHAYKEWHEHKPKNVPFEDFVIDVVNFALATYFSSYTDLLGKEEGERLIKIYSWKAGIDVDWGCQSTYMSSSEFLHPELAHRESEKSKATKIKSLIQHLKKD